jgi:hypothetical protein
MMEMDWFLRVLVHRWFNRINRCSAADVAAVEYFFNRL